MNEIEALEYPLMGTAAPQILADTCCGICAKLMNDKTFKSRGRIWMIADRIDIQLYIVVLWNLCLLATL